MKLTVDWNKDILSKQILDLKKIKQEFLVEYPKWKNKGVYSSQVVEWYYKQKYDKSLLEVLNFVYDIPRCPITNDFVSFFHGGKLRLNKFSKTASKSQKNKYIAENNPGFLAHIERMKIERKGSGNPAYGTDPWNKNLTKQVSKSLESTSKKAKQRFKSLSNLEKQKIKDNQSKAALERIIHGHTGIKHSETTKEILRQKTIKRLQEGKFPQTDTLPCRIFKEILQELNIKYQEEIRVGYYVFDFQIDNNLVEIQGDYWHCNPNSKYKTPKFPAQIKNLQRDKRKQSYIKNNKSEFNLVILWEHDLINNKDQIKELCTKKFKKLNLSDYKKPTILK